MKAALTYQAIHDRIRHYEHNPGADYPNTGLVLDYGFDSLKNMADVVGDAAVCRPSVLYEKAYRRWEAKTGDESRFACWPGRIAGRLFLARGETSVLETSARLHHTYGIPYLPGSMLKGIARAYAIGGNGKQGMSTEHLDCLFGCEPKVSDAPTEADSGDSGYVIFHDAWWMPGSAATPLAKEVITPHHGAYYQSQGETPPRDTDSPTITSQIAVRGAFLFAVEGVGEWKKTAVNLLKAALQSEGLGSRTHLGYGLFVG